MQFTLINNGNFRVENLSKVSGRLQGLSVRCSAVLLNESLGNTVNMKNRKIRFLINRMPLTL
jgi:hypothetical protein